MVNKLILQGRLVADPELRHTQSGTSVCSFRVAWSEKYKENETKLFLSCTAWGGTGEMVSRYFQKGKEIIVEGKLSTRSYTDKEGQNRQSTELTVERVHFSGGKSDGGEGSNSVQAPLQEPELNNIDDGDLPF